VPKDLSPQIARVNHLPDNKGVLVERPTDAQSPAARAGLTGGDVIVSVNNQKVKNFREVIRLIAAQPIGSTANVAYVRGGKSMTAAVKLEERLSAKPAENPPIFDPDNPKGLRPMPPTGPAKPQAQSRAANAAKFTPSLGLNVKFLAGEIARQFNVDAQQGAYIASIDPTGVAGLAGVMSDDLLTEINYMPVRSMNEYQMLSSTLKSGDDVVLKIYRRDPASFNRLSIIISFTMP
jgi:S1-C subfamily serine protease